MATQWGRKETIIWPPHAPMLSYTAVATALLFICVLVWQRFTSVLEPLQKSYITEYIRSEAGGLFNAHESYRLLYLGGGRGKPRLAFPVDFVAGQTVLPSRKDTSCCPVTFGGRPGISLALQRDRTEVGRPVSTPVAQPYRLRGQWPFRALRRQLRRGRSLPRGHALVRCSV